MKSTSPYPPKSPLAEAEGRSEVIETLASVFASYAMGGSPRRKSAGDGGAGAAAAAREEEERARAAAAAAADAARREAEESRRRAQAEEAAAARREAERRREAEAAQEAARAAARERDAAAAREREASAAREKAMREAAEGARRVSELQAALEASQREMQRLKEALAASTAQANDAAGRAAKMESLQAENERLRLNLNEAVAKLGDSVRALEEKASGTGRLESRIKALEAERDSLKADRDSLATRFEAALRAQEGDKGSRDRELEAARASAEAAVGSLREAQGEVNRLRGVLRSMEEEASARSNQLSQLAAALADSQTEMAGLRGEYGDKLLLSTQVAHLQLDNGRLLALLRRTKEYATMAGQLFPAARAARVLAAVGAAGGGGDAEEAAADVAPGYRLRSTYLGSLPQGLPGSYSYLGGVPPGAHPPPSNGSLLDMVPNGDRKWDALNGLEESYGDYADRVAVGMEAERGMAAAAFTNGLSPYPPPVEGELFDRALEAQRWVPSDAVALSSAFRQRYLNHVNHEDVRAFLIGLQLIWAARCEEEIAASRAALLKKIKELKRAIAQKMPYREVMQASTIARINQELTGMRYRMGLSGGVSGPAVPQSDHDAHAVAFGRTASIEGGGNGSGGNGGGRSTSPVRAFLQSVTRFGATLGGSGSGSGSGSSYGVTRMDGEGGDNGGGGYEGGGRNTAMLSTALREAASRLRATTFPAPPSAAKNPGAPQLAVTLQRVPGSGARRLDAIEAAQLLEAALAAVDELSHANAAMKIVCESQETALREAAGEAEEEMNLRRATSAVAERERALALSRTGGQGGGGGGTGGAGYRNPGLPESYSTSHHLPYAALGGFAGTVTAQLASKAGLAYPPPQPLAPPGAGPGNHYPTSSGSGSNSYSVPFGGSGAFPPPFAHSPQHQQHQHQHQQQSYGGGSGVARSPFPGSQGPIRASHTSTHFNAFPPPPPPQTYHVGGSGEQQFNSNSGSSSSTPIRQRRLSVGDAVKAALGAALQSAVNP